MINFIKLWIWKLCYFVQSKVNPLPEFNLMDNNEEFLEFDPPGEEIKPMKFPEVPRTYVASPEVRLFSYYFKKLGANQDLSYGDWYYIEENGLGITKIYYKNDVNNYDDFKFFASKRYIRIIGQDEALNIIRVLGYDYAYECPVEFNEFGQITLKLESYDGATSLSVTASNAHAAHVKAAFLAYTQIKNINDLTYDLSKEGWIKDNEETEEN